MSSTIQPAELGFFSALAASPSLSAAGREMGVSTAAVSKHLAQMERRMGVVLINRTTRRMSLTPEGEMLLEHARRILREIDALDELIVQSKASPKGLLRVNATFRSRVCRAGFAVTCSMACITAWAASASPRCSSSITTDQKVPIGLARPLPMMSNAEP